MEKQNNLVRTIVTNGVIAGLYVALTVAFQPLSYGDIQIRFSEALVLLCFFNRRYTIGLTLGCFIANFFSPFWVIDIWLGTLATLISCIAISFCKHLFIATLPPVIANAFLVALMLRMEYQLPYFMTALTVGIGEAIAVCVFGYFVFMLIGRHPHVQKVMGFNRQLDFKW